MTRPFPNHYFKPNLHCPYWYPPHLGLVRVKRHMRIYLAPQHLQQHDSQTRNPLHARNGGHD